MHRPRTQRPSVSPATSAYAPTALSETAKRSVSPSGGPLAVDYQGGLKFKASDHKADFDNESK